MSWKDDLTPAERQEIYDGNRKWLADEPPLPEAIALAKPIVDALMNLRDWYDGRAEAYQWWFEHGEYVADVEQLIATIDDVCTLVSTKVESMLTSDQCRSLIPAMVAGILRAIADVDELAHEYTIRRYDLIVENMTPEVAAAAQRHGAPS